MRLSTVVNNVYLAPDIGLNIEYCSLERAGDVTVMISSR